MDSIQELRKAMAANPFMGEAGGPGQTVDVIVPIHNAVADLRRCVASVVLETSSPFRLILINDGSTDPGVSRFLEAIGDACPRLLVLDRGDNRGFVRTVNEGFALSSTADVVILNSDTVVSRGWLQKMVEVARSRPDVATVTPLTNNGTLCAVPNAFEENEIPVGYDVQGFADLVEATSQRLFPEAPTGVGFCMLVTRRALAELGGFDAETFGDGYGEENDFCQRAIQAGLVNLIADHTFVYHKGRASFGDRSDSLMASNLGSVGRKHSGYHAEVERFRRTHPLSAFHTRIRERIARSGGVGLRVLHILHQGGGTEKHARDLAAVQDPTIVSYVLTSDGRHLDVDGYHAGGRLQALRFPLPSAIGRYGPLRDAGYHAALTTICATLEISLIHVHHLIHNTLDIADVAAALGIPYVMTLHDYHTICPMYALIDPDGHPCGACTADDGRPVARCLNHVGQPASYLAEYQGAMGQFLAGAARLFVPSSSARDIIVARYPAVMHRASVIEHGHWRSAESDVHAARARTILPRHSSGAPLRVALIGGLEPHKGYAVFRDLLRANRSDEVVFHLYGTAPDKEIAEGPRDRLRRLDGSLFLYRGAYDSKDIVRMLTADGIDVGIQPAIWPETFSYTLSEFADASVPVIAGAIGAQGERVDRYRLGWTVPDIRDPHATLAILDSIVRDPSILADARRQMRRDEALPRLETAWRTYVDAYMEIAASKESQPTGEVASTRISPEYVASLAAAVSEATRGEQRPDLLLIRRDAELAAVRQLLRSPRYRIADAIAGAIQKIPGAWPVLTRVTDTILRWERRRGRG